MLYSRKLTEHCKPAIMEKKNKTHYIEKKNVNSPPPHKVECYSVVKKKNSAAICENMDKNTRHNAKWNKPDREWYHLYVES